MVGRPERPVDPNDGPVAAFADQLRQLRRRAGNRPYRELAARAHFSHTTISDAARGERLPTLEVTLAFVKACGGDIEDWKGRWHAYHHLMLAANPPKITPAAGPAAHGQSGPGPADRTSVVLSSDDEVLESPQPRHTERQQPAPAGNRLPPEHRRLMVGLATALLSFATGWQIRTMDGATATAIAQGASTAESASATSPESSTISTSDSGSVVSIGALDPRRKTQQPWYKPGELPFNETLAWTYATPAAMPRSLV